MTTARIGIDYTAAIHQTAGIGRYVRELTRALADWLPGANVCLFVAAAGRADLPPYPGGFTYRPSRLSERNHARLWHRLRLPLPIELWTGPLDLFHATDFTLPPTHRNTKTVLTIHDLAFERYPAETMPGMQRFLSTVVPRSLSRADHVIAVSEATRKDLIELCDTPPEKITVVPNGVSPRFRPLTASEIGEQAQKETAIRAKYGLPDGPLVLTVGTLQPRKNHQRLVQAFAQVREPATLVIAGGRGWAYNTTHNEVTRLGLTDRVVFAGFIDDADLPALYRTATVFAYPALYEGFGLPPLEAMACGVPVLAANTSSLPEVIGEAGLLVDPFDVEGLAAGLEKLLGDEALRASLREKGITRAGGFTWAQAAEKVWGIYQALLDQPHNTL